MIIIVQMDETPTNSVPEALPKAEQKATVEQAQPAPGNTKKKVKTKPDKYHAALKGKMASAGKCAVMSPMRCLDVLMSSQVSLGRKEK